MECVYKSTFCLFFVGRFGLGSECYLLAIKYLGTYGVELIG